MCPVPDGSFMRMTTPPRAWSEVATLAIEPEREDDGCWLADLAALAGATFDRRDRDWSVVDLCEGFRRGGLQPAGVGPAEAGPS